MSFSQKYITECATILGQLDPEQIETLAEMLAGVREAGGRLFILGVGGSSASASHAVNDFRKIAGFEAYAPTDNVSELTARVNDDGWAGTFSQWLRGSRLRDNDALLILSVGGGDEARNVSPNLVEAIRLAGKTGARVFGVVGRDGGYTARQADAVVIVPTVNDQHITPHTESFHSVICHLLVSHPKLKVSQTKWESQT